MNIPKRVNVLGVSYDVEIAPVVSKERLVVGLSDHIKQKILIDEDMSQEQREQTLLHEIVHCILVQLAQVDANEDEVFVQGVALALHGIISELNEQAPIEEDPLHEALEKLLNDN